MAQGGAILSAMGLIDEPRGSAWQIGLLEDTGHLLRSIFRLQTQGAMQRYADPRAAFALPAISSVDYPFDIATGGREG